MRTCGSGFVECIHNLWLQYCYKPPNYMFTVALIGENAWKTLLLCSPMTYKAWFVISEAGIKERSDQRKVHHQAVRCLFCYTKEMCPPPYVLPIFMLFSYYCLLVKLSFLFCAAIPLKTSVMKIGPDRLLDQQSSKTIYYVTGVNPAHLVG